MKLSDYNKKTLMLCLHQKIEEYAEYTSELINKGENIDFLTYPQNGGLTEEEQKAIKSITNNPVLKSALRKIIADNSAGVLFDLLNLIDGTTDPDSNLGKWSEISFVDKTDNIVENDEMLHDSFFETYWDWTKIRSEKEWKLDNIID